MNYLGILVAALAAYGFGALWYMTLAKHWVQAAGVATDDSGQPVNKGDPIPYLVAFASCLLMAAMMRYVFTQIGVTGAGQGLIGGFAIGLFLSAPWLTTCYMFAGRPNKLIFIDGGYAVGGSTLAGLVLTLL
jgi:hypothetical protein